MRFVSYITPDYLPGVMTLAYSIKKNGNYPANFTVLLNGELTLVEKNALKQVCDDLEIFNVDDFDKFDFDSNLMQNKERMTNLNKFLIYKLPYNEKMCFLDSDIICLNDISDIDDFQPFSAVVNLGKNNPDIVNNRPMFNTGFMIFRPDEEAYKEIQSYAERFNKETKWGDQGITNYFYYENYPEKVNILSFIWNAAVTKRRYRKKLWRSIDDEGIKFLHLTMCKPWDYVNDRSKYLRRSYYYYSEEINKWLTLWNDMKKENEINYEIGRHQESFIGKKLNVI